jgi:hypothetical protein
MGKGEIEDRTIKDFIQKLKKRFKIERIILFGSRAEGEALKDSDYDFIIVSKDFEGIFFTDRTSLLYDLWDSELSLEALCYTPEEFDKKAREIGIVKEAIKHGIRLS